MADLLTVYDDGESNTFIDCTICDKRIRGDTNYKIHLTTLQHLKRERALADKGLIPKPVPLPQWTSIKEYLTYLNLNEPIIGLSALVQDEDFFSNDGRAVLRYRCRLCAVQMDLYDMTTHVVGRRHRQKYLERNRPDLVTWEKTSEKQAGVVARAKAAMVEKQEGWGNPVPLIRSEKGRSLRNRAYDGAAHNRLSDARGRASSGQDRREQNIYKQSYREGDAYVRPSHYHEDNQYDQSSFREDVTYRSSSSGDNRYDAPYSQDGGQGRSYRERDYMDRPYREDETNMATFPGDGNRDRRYADKDVPQSCHDEWYPETNSSREPYKSREGDDYYHGNISENRFGESGMDYQESRRMQEPMYTSQHETGSSMDERQRQSRSLSYTEKGRERFQDVDERRGSYEMEGYNKRERYYSTEDDVPAKKKRKSRFSDASPLEMALAQKSQIDEMILKYKQKGRAGPTKNQASGYSMDSSVTPRMENVLDVLNDIQIENVQEANFLKDKLCTLLKEFQSSKVQRSQVQVSQTSTDFTDSYHSGSKMEQRREMPESRRFDDQGFQEPARYDRDLQGPREYLNTRHVEEDPKIMRQNRGLEEPEYQWDPYRGGSAGRSDERMARHTDDRRDYREGAWNSRPLREEERVYTEEHRYQHDYRSGGDLYDPFEPSSSPPMESTSSTLDKLASTLLELVARKTN
ncbi:uncharacterized protein si:ch211-13c6.2 [Neoarius graeffei]|uniref:uncharacterized protein si:ch211-13c6.2 n=1 Tax=Neoarius graeffei TaxID=443677 RepID=UPI00298CB372|nr:uncharacterized protein si:ch211-13c6.2 [Neoarius graeffei]